jgi:biotin carboxyl carrier protein
MTEGHKMFKVIANEFEFSLGQNEINAVDIVKKSPSEFHLIKNYRSVKVNLVSCDSSGKKMKIEVAGEIFDVEIKNQLDQELEKMGFGAVTGKQIREIRAPMPGLVLEIAVVDGQEVKEGDKILILEAMKMENCISIHTSATIKRIAVTSGQAVEKGQVLVELE